MPNSLVGLVKGIMKEREKRNKEFAQKAHAWAEKEAAKIIKLLRQTILDADKRGEKSVVVMTCHGGESGPDSLEGLSRIVYQACIEAGLNVELKNTSQELHGGDSVNEMTMYLTLD